MRLVVLIDNCTINGRNLKGEGGASYYIEDEDKKFLLDTGASGLFMENAKNLDINLDDIDTVVLSHGHYDHAGGIKDFIESRDDKINIICHPLSFNKKKKGNTNMGAPYRKDEIIKDYIDSKVKYSSIDWKKSFIEEDCGYKSVIIPQNKNDHIKAMYDYLVVMTDRNKSLNGEAFNFHLGRCKVNERIQFYLNRVFLPLIHYINDYLIEEMISLKES